MSDDQEIPLKDKREREKFLARQAKDDTTWVMSDERGRRWIWNLLGFCGIHETSFSTNALAMANREGQRNVGLRVEADVLAAGPDLYLAMQGEAFKRKQKEAKNG